MTQGPAVVVRETWCLKSFSGPTEDFVVYLIKPGHLIVVFVPFVSTDVVQVVWNRFYHERWKNFKVKAFDIKRRYKSLSGNIVVLGVGEQCIL